MRTIVFSQNDSTVIFEDKGTQTLITIRCGDKCDCNLGEMLIPTASILSYIEDKYETEIRTDG